MARIVGRSLARNQIVEALSSGPKRYSELVKLTERPDKTIFVSLGHLQTEELIRKRSDGLYELTDSGARAAQEIKSEQVVKSSLNLVSEATNTSEFEARILFAAYLVIYSLKQATSDPNLVKIHDKAVAKLDVIDRVMKKVSTPGQYNSLMNAINKVDGISESRPIHGSMYTTGFSGLALSSILAEVEANAPLPEGQPKKLLIDALHFQMESSKQVLNQAFKEKVFD